MYILMSIYILAALFVFAFSMGQAYLACIVVLRGDKPAPSLPNPAQLPYVTVQLPIYNEALVVERLINAVVKMSYPTDRWEIQILDDSTDETSEIIQRHLRRLDASMSIHHIRRTQRSDYKAGALSEALPRAKGAIIAIFDADFIPPVDFLERTVPYFRDRPKLGFIQTRWGHINEEENLLTRLQAFGLNGHFFIEQSARAEQKYFTNFNGSAGLWRRSCIIEAGNWKSDTLTEDLDLSYRAHFLGWRYLYLSDLVCPAELPSNMSDVKQQQRRWNRGAAQNARKHLLALFRSSATLPQKLHGFLHLMNSSVYLCLLTVAILSVPIMYLREHNLELALWFRATTGLWFGFLGFLFFYLQTSRYSSPKTPWRYLFSRFFWFMSFSMASLGRIVELCCSGG